eukprot:CAMPEP_0114664812 /NCGR_PEP_ID=MMETSP0191-20121206/29512_1 /TAXON_ID=126664 /ORGANISM="Sorites sp." /LENGTH=98 /DNA_ID=CAMNT_0001907989 /DNA_START=204 /DNA_END=500 /DNA_ORIENTATION=-
MEKATIACIDFDCCLKQGMDQLRFFCCDLHVREIDNKELCKIQAKQCCIITNCVIPPDAAAVPPIIGCCLVTCFPKFGAMSKVEELRSMRTPEVQAQG